MPKEANFRCTRYVHCVDHVFRRHAKCGSRAGEVQRAAPEYDGKSNFERVLRVQQNTLEQLVVFLPALWIFSFLVDPKIGAGLGGVWIVGRIFYAWGYYKAADKRGPGFGIAFLAQAALLLGSLYGAVMNVLH